MSRFLGPLLLPLGALLIMVPVIVGIGLLLLAVGHIAAIFVGVAIMTVITVVAILFDRRPRPVPAAAGVVAATAASPADVGKFFWRAALGLSFLALVAIAFYLTFAWINIAHLYPTVGLLVIVSGIVGTPALIGLGVAAALLRPRWA